MYAPACAGGCTITAYDPRSSAARWSVSVPANVEQSQTGSGVLVVQTFPTGGAPRFLVLDPASGASRAAIDLPRDHYLTLAGRHLVDAGASSPPPRSGCTARVAGYGLDGAVAWRRSLELGRTRDKRCDAYYAATNTSCGSGKQCTVVLDGRSGRQLLKAPGVPQNFVPGPRPGLMTRIDSGKR